MIQPFPWSQLDLAMDTSLALARKYPVGFFDASTNDPTPLFPEEFDKENFLGLTKS